MRKEEGLGCLAEVDGDTAKAWPEMRRAHPDVRPALGRFGRPLQEVIELQRNSQRPSAPPTSADLSLELSAWMFFIGERTKTLAKARPRKRKWSLPAQPSKNSRGLNRIRAAYRVSDDPSLLLGPRRSSLK